MAIEQLQFHMGDAGDRKRVSVEYRGPEDVTQRRKVAGRTKVSE